MSNSAERKGAHARIEDGYAVVRIPLEQVHGYRVALAPCPCRAAKSIETSKLREKLAHALGRLMAGGK